jgi:hypothetical protein
MLFMLSYCYKLPMKYVWFAVRNFDAFFNRLKFEAVNF